MGTGKDLERLFPRRYKDACSSNINLEPIFPDRAEAIKN